MGPDRIVCALPLSADSIDDLTRLVYTHLCFPVSELAFAMACHPRLGSESPARGLSAELVSLIFAHEIRPSA